MKKTVLFLLVILCAQSAFAVKTGTFTVKVAINGNQRSINYYVPGYYDSTKSIPMLWGWGAGMTGAEMLERLKQMQNKINGIIVCPDLNGLGGNEYDEMAEYSYNYTRQNYNIDTQKIVITGFSMGAGKAMGIGLGKPSRVKGIICMAPAMTKSSMDENMWSNVSKVRIAAIMGLKDSGKDAVSVLMDEIESKGGSVLYIEKEGLDHMGTNGYYKTQAFINDYMNCYNFVVSNSTDVEEEATGSGNGLAVFPNPATEFISINIDSNDDPSFQGRIYNQIGDCVMTLEKNSGIIDISGLEQGLYSIVVVNGSKTMAGRFIVVK